MPKLALGTAQFGLDYGINNKAGMIPKEEAGRIMYLALENDVDLFDTASSYGESEKVIGSYFNGKTVATSIVSKLNAKTKEEASGMIETTLKNLRLKMIYGYLLHDFNSYKNNPAIYAALIDAKKAGKIKKIGFSLYYPKELNELLANNVPLDIIQVPYSIFDRRFEPYFPDLKRRGIEIHVRSVYLQGLVFKPLTEVNDDLLFLKQKLKSLLELSLNKSIPVYSLCLNFAMLNDAIDRVVVGVDSLDNLKETLTASSYMPQVKSLYEELKLLREDNEQFVLPTNWKVSK